MIDWEYCYEHGCYNKVLVQFDNTEDREDKCVVHRRSNYVRPLPGSDIVAKSVAPQPEVHGGFHAWADIGAVADWIFEQDPNDLPEVWFEPLDAGSFSFLGAWDWHMYAKRGYTVTLGDAVDSQPPVAHVVQHPITVNNVTVPAGGTLVVESTGVDWSLSGFAESTGFVKHDGDKPQFDLIPPEVELEVAKAFTHGAKKYSANNYRKGTRWGRYVAAARRHMNAWQLGETTDPDSGLSHLAHAIASLMMLQTLQITGVGEDDRVPPGKRAAK